MNAMNPMNAVRPLVVVTLAATLAGCRGGAPEFTPAPGPSALVETVGSRPFVLRANAGTGYGWTATSSDPAVASIGPVETRDFASSALGGYGGRPVGGPMEWVFPVTFHRPGKATITFALARPWEKDTPPAEASTVEVTVE